MEVSREEFEQLDNSLSRCVELLRSVAEDHWATRLERAQSRLAREPGVYSLEALLSDFGGMGSVNDLVLSEINGHEFENCDENAANRELSELRSLIYRVADGLRRTLNQKSRTRPSP